VIALQLAFIIMALAIDVHQIKLVDQTLSLQQAKRSINRAAVNTWIKFLRLAKNLAGVEMFAGSFHHAENGSALLGHADTALGTVGLEPARHFGLGQRHWGILQAVATGRNQSATETCAAVLTLRPYSGSMNVT